MEFNDQAVKQIRELMKDPVFDKIHQQNHAKSLRNEVTADWISNFMNRMRLNNSPEHLVDAKTGEAHTVESLVSEMRERVKLDSLQKEAQDESFPLTSFEVEASEKKKSKLSEEDKRRISSFIEDMYSSHRGYCDSPAILHACRDKFGIDSVNDNSRFIESIIHELKDRYKTPALTMILPDMYQGQPEKAAPGTEMQPLFENIKNI